MEMIEDFKKLPAADRHNEAQLEQLRKEMTAMAELLLDIWLSKRVKDGRV